MGSEDTKKDGVIKEEDIAKEVWGTMPLGKKLEYLWMYYKTWLIGVIALILVICVGVTMYQNIHTKVLLNVIVIGGDDLKAEQLEESFVQYAGIEEKDGIVQIRTNIPDDGGSVSSMTALTTLMGAEAVDVLVCPKRVYEEYGSEGGFMDIGDVLGENAAEYGDAVQGFGVLLKDDNVLSREEMTSYDEIYAAVSVNCQNQEMAAVFMEYLMQ